MSQLKYSKLAPFQKERLAIPPVMSLHQMSLELKNKELFIPIVRRPCKNE